jgi:hypothetical protein
MKKTIPLLIIGFLIVQGVSTIAVEKNDYSKMNISENYIFSEINIFEANNDYISIKLEDATSYLLETGDPMLPKISKVFTLPFGSYVENIEVEYKNLETFEIDGIIKPAPKPVIDGSTENPMVNPSEVYSIDSFYPTQDFSYYQKVGLEKGEHVVFLSIHCYPIKYNPVQKTLTYSDEIEIKISYNKPIQPVSFADNYDLLIIAPSEFASSIQPLIDHKNSVEVQTYLLTLDEIYSDFSSGRNDQEKIKLAIKDAVETQGINYVLLVGGLEGQSKNWYLPVIYGQSLSENGYISDLYYSDLYKMVDDEVVFEDWDSNGNGDFAEFGMFTKDLIDGAPDVYIGRLACRSVSQVDTMVDKIISYEATKADDSWFKNMLLIGGDTYPESTGGGFEAEIDTELSSSHMTDFNHIKLWASLETLTGKDDTEEGINQGAGFIHMAGHANPASLVTFPPFDAQKEEKIVIMAMYDLYDFGHSFPKLNNNEKQPIIVVGGCHNSQFNVSLANMIEGILAYGINGYFFSSPMKFFYMEWIPKCWSWWLISQPTDGAIAIMGNTGLGMGIWDFDYVTGLDGWLFPRYFYHYGQEDEYNVGMAHSSAITDYVNEFDINKDGEDRQMIQQWALLGDPSLLPGGY